MQQTHPGLIAGNNIYSKVCLNYWSIWVECYTWSPEDYSEDKRASHVDEILIHYSSEKSRQGVFPFWKGPRENPIDQIFHQKGFFPSTIFREVPFDARNPPSLLPSWNSSIIHVISQKMAKNQFNGEPLRWDACFHISAHPCSMAVLLCLITLSTYLILISLLSALPNTQTISMSPPHTVGVPQNACVQDDDDDDICPVCDGECTCDNRPRVHPQPTSLDQSSFVYAGSSSSIISSIPRSSPKPNPLKIKLTVPQKSLKYKKPSSAPKKIQEMTSGFAPVGETQFDSLPQSKKTLQRRRGRPPKTVTAARELVKAQPTVYLHSPSSPSPFAQPSVPTVGNSRRSNPRLPQKRGPKAKRVGPKRPSKRKRRAFSDHHDKKSFSHLSDGDYDCDNDDDGDPAKFPTFLSASGLSSSDSSDSSPSDPDPLSSAGDSDIEKEEENYIVSQIHEKARLRRELFKEDGIRNHSSQNDWVIRSRKKSVDLSDNEMNVDSDVTEDDDEEDQAADEAEEETNNRAVGAGYAGLVTAWSDDEESSFDADIFFANLTDSDSDSNHSDSSCSGAGEDGDHSDMDAASHSDTTERISHSQRPENLQLEVTQGWDGQVVFTNGLNDGRGLLDLDFEVKASQFLPEVSSGPAQDTDVDMSPTHRGPSSEEDFDGAEGDTTDEELVGKDDLPNERAMQLFHLPSSVSAVNPLSIVSPTVSPARHRLVSSWQGMESSKPGNNLAGRLYWDSDDQDEEEEERKGGLPQQSRGPRAGIFVPAQESRKAIIDGTREVPSPHPRINRCRKSLAAPKVNMVRLQCAFCS